MKTSTATGTLVLALLGAPLLAAFGTIHGLGQDAEHERITRHAFACAAGEAPDDCFEQRTLDSLAGKRGTFGAVGIADRGTLILKAAAHCDGGDYLAVKFYPQSKTEAREKLVACRAWMAEQLDAAIEAAGDLLDAEGQIDDSQIPTIVSCNYGGRVKGRAKCNVLEAFGLLLHASQDFYSHTNWTDVADKDVPYGPANPPGMGKAGPAPWLDLRTDKPFPDGLISGCFEAKSAISEPANCNYGPRDTPRAKHLALNKDKGQIDPKVGEGTTSRGRINGNFARAVEAAIADTKDKWETLKEQLVLTYGPSRGMRMVCALTRDDPAKTC